jgi:hypothetical protein
MTGAGTSSRARAQAPRPVHTCPAPARRGWSAAASSISASRDRPVVRPPRCALAASPRGNGGRVAAVLLVDNAAQPMQRPRSPPSRASRSPATPASCTSSSPHFDQVKGNNLPGLQRPRAARPGVGRERAEVHRRRAGPGGRARPAPTDRPGALLRRRYPGSARRQEQGRLVFDPAARRGPEPLGGPRTRRRCRHEPSRVQPHEPVAGPDGGSQDLPHPLARHPRSGLQPGRT